MLIRAFCLGRATGVRFFNASATASCVEKAMTSLTTLTINSIALLSFSALTDLMNELGLTISQKKLVPPSTQVTCLGMIIDTVKGTISIPPNKLCDVTSTVRQWFSFDVASRLELQSILGLLLYVRYAHIFLNRKLDLLRFAHSRQKVMLTSDFRRDLKWFAKFLPVYNGVSLYEGRPIDVTLELDACLTGLGGHSGNFIYHLPIPMGYRNWTIVHLNMVNILTYSRKALQPPMGVKSVDTL